MIGEDIYLTVGFPRAAGTAVAVSAELVAAVVEVAAAAAER